MNRNREIGREYKALEGSVEGGVKRKGARVGGEKKD